MDIAVGGNKMGATIPITVYMSDEKYKEYIDLSDDVKVNAKNKARYAFMDVIEEALR